MLVWGTGGLEETMLSLIKFSWWIDLFFEGIQSCHFSIIFSLMEFLESNLDGILIWSNLSYFVLTIFPNEFRIYSNISNSFNKFLANVLILCPLKTTENQRFSGVSWGYKMRTFARYGLRARFGITE